MKHEQIVEELSDSDCAICGKPKARHTMNCGVGMCQIYPAFVSKREMFARLRPTPSPDLVERVARAIYEVSFDDTYPGDGSHDAECCKDMAEQAASAAIVAMTGVSRVMR